ncbi:MAG TPA: hypothetical protein VFX70_17100, partial [Mycobacteriales bacterium]|nr:hypothetical protein [Mycobacteriales bacterium]
MARPGKSSAPNLAVRSRQLTEARAEFGWLAAGSVTVQQQALRDLGQAMGDFFAGTHRRPDDLAGTRRVDRCRDRGEGDMPPSGPVPGDPVGLRARSDPGQRGRTRDAVGQNAARNIAAGHAVTARGGPALARPVNRE